MGFIEAITDNVFLLKIRVKPNSKVQRIASFSENDPFLIILLRSKAIHNNANKELLSLIKTRLKISLNQIKLNSGMKTKDKIISIELHEKVTKNMILNMLKD